MKIQSPTAQNTFVSMLLSATTKQNTNCRGSRIPLPTSTSSRTCYDFRYGQTYCWRVFIQRSTIPSNNAFVQLWKRHFWSKVDQKNVIHRLELKDKHKARSRRNPSSGFGMLVHVQHFGTIREITSNNFILLASLAGWKDFNKRELRLESPSSLELLAFPFFS